MAEPKKVISKPIEPVKPAGVVWDKGPVKFKNFQASFKTKSFIGFRRGSR